MVCKLIRFWVVLVKIVTTFYMMGRESYESE